MNVLRIALLASGAILFTPRLASAESVAVEPPAAATCVSAKELADALARAKVHVRPAEPGEQSTHVSIDGTPRSLRISIDRNGARQTTVLPAATCDTATDAAAAFLASTLAPPPAPPARVGLDELMRAIGTELAQRDVQLALEGLLVTLTRDAWGNVHAYVKPRRAAGCSRDVPLGVIDQATPETVGAATDALFEALAATRACVESQLTPGDQPPKAPPPEVDPIRVNALQKALDRVPRPNGRAVAALLELTSGIVFTLIEPSPATRHDPTARTFRAWGSAFMLGGAIGTLTVPRDRSMDFNVATSFAGYGFFAAASLFGGDTFARQATAGGFFVSASLAALNFGHPRPLTRLNAERRDAAQAGLTQERAAAIERDLERADPLVPPWLVVTPLVIGNALAAAHTLAHEPTDASLLVVNFTFAGGFGIAAIIDAAHGSIWGSYQRALHAAGLKQLSLGPGPTPLGCSIVGSF